MLRRRYRPQEGVVIIVDDIEDDEVDRAPKGSGRLASPAGRDPVAEKKLEFFREVKIWIRL